MSENELEEVGKKGNIVTLKKLSKKEGEKTKVAVGKEKTITLNKPIKKGHVIMRTRYCDGSRTANKNGEKSYKTTSEVLRITPTEVHAQFEIETSTSIYSAVFRT
jgi:hypothetical protein